MSHLLVTLAVLLNDALSAYLVLVVARGVIGLLLHFGVLNSANTIVAGVLDITAALVDPVTTKLKNLLPFLVFRSVDLSLVALYFVVQIVQAGLLATVI